MRRILAGRISRPLSTDEVEGIFEKGTFKEVRKSDFSKEELNNLTIMKAKLVLAIKDPGTPEDLEKATLVVQVTGSKDKEKRLLFTYSPTVTRSSVRVTLSAAARMKQFTFATSAKHTFRWTRNCFEKSTSRLRPS